MTALFRQPDQWFFSDLSSSQPGGISVTNTDLDNVSSLTTQAPGTPRVVSVPQLPEVTVDPPVANYTAGDDPDSGGAISISAGRQDPTEKTYVKAFFQIVNVAVSVDLDMAADHPCETSDIDLLDSQRKKGLCLAVASCIREVDPSLAVSLGMLYSTAKLKLMPRWNDSIVVVDAVGTRIPVYVIDFDFRSKFMIARASPAYRMLVRALPSIFVGTMQELRVRIYYTAAAAEACLQGQGMPLAPWRKAAAMLSLYTTVANRSHAGFHRSQRLLEDVITQSSKARTRTALNPRCRWSLQEEESKVQADVADSALVGRAARVCSLTLTKLQWDQPSWAAVTFLAHHFPLCGGAQDGGGDYFEKVPVPPVDRVPQSNLAALLALAGKIADNLVVTVV